MNDKVIIGVAEAFKKFSPEILLAAEQITAGLIDERVKATEIVFREIYHRVDDPDLRDYIALMCRTICHPNTQFDPETHQ